MTLKKLSIILVLNGLAFITIGQSIYNPSIFSSHNNGLVQYTVQNAGNKTYIFMLNGDGTFGNKTSQIQHKFAPSLSGYTTKAYFAKGYDPHPPTERTINTGPTGIGNTTTNPTRQLSGAIEILFSWAPALGFQNFFILAFKNTTDSTIEGCIEFQYNTSQIQVDTPNILVYNSWVNNRSSSALSGTLDKQQKWNFSGLLPGEIRYVYVPAYVSVKVGQPINLAAKLKVNCKDGKNGNGSTTSNTSSSRFPHDPNSKLSNRACFIADHTEEEIKYKITFFNDGNGFAKDVFVTDVLPPDLNPSTVQIIDSEYPCNWVINENELQIDFFDIYLPGTDQTIPHTYSYEEASTYVTFSICTNRSLNMGDCIVNKATIVFDNQPEFTTEPSKICCTEECFEFMPCLSYREKANEKEEKEIVPIDYLQLFPNPTNDQLNIVFQPQSSSVITITLLDYSGKMVKQLFQSDKQFELFEKQFYLDDLPKGIYMMVLQTNDTIHTQKIIKL